MEYETGNCVDHPEAKKQAVQEVLCLLLGYEPNTSIDEGLRKFAEWLNSSDYRDSFAMTDSKRATSMFLAFEG